MPRPEIWLPVDEQRCASKLTVENVTHECSNYRNHEGKHYDASTGRKWSSQEADG
jgi:hypothetical protein